MAINNVLNVPLSANTGTGQFVGSSAPIMSNVTVDNINFSGNTLSSINANGNLNLLANGSGNYIFGNSGGVTPGVNSYSMHNVGLPGTAGATTNNYCYLNSSLTCSFSMFKSRSTTVGSFSVVQANDVLGLIRFYGDTGSAFSPRTQIQSNVTTVGTSIGTNLLFYTSNASNSSEILALTIDDSQNVILNNSSAALFVGNLSLIGNTLSTTNTNGNMIFTPNGNGYVIFGNATTNPLAAYSPDNSLINYGNPGTRPGYICSSSYISGTNYPAAFNSVRSRSNTLGGNAALLAGDNIGLWDFRADNGTVIESRAQILCSVTTVGTQIGTKLEFYTGSTSNINPILALTVDDSQNVTLNNSSATLTAPKFVTTPPASQASSLVVGTAYQNTFGYDVVVTVYLAVTAAVAGTILVGVGSTSTPAQQTVVSGLNLASALIIIPITIYLPSGYYALLTTGGTSVSQTISGQQAMPV